MSSAKLKESCRADLALVLGSRHAAWESSVLYPHPTNPCDQPGSQRYAPNEARQICKNLWLTPSAFMAAGVHVVSFTSYPS